MAFPTLMPVSDGVAYFYQDKRDEAKKAFDLSVRKHLVAGRRDLAIKVKQESDALFGAQP